MTTLGRIAGTDGILALVALLAMMFGATNERVFKIAFGFCIGLIGFGIALLILRIWGVN